MSRLLFAGLSAVLLVLFERRVTGADFELNCCWGAGQSSIRPYWRCYYANTQVSFGIERASRSTLGLILDLMRFPFIHLSPGSSGRNSRTSLTSFYILSSTSQAIIYVIDSADTSRLPTSRSELLTMLSEDELKNVPVLVFANKQVSARMTCRGEWDVPSTEETDFG